MVIACSVVTLLKMSFFGGLYRLPLPLPIGGGGGALSGCTKLHDAPLEQWPAKKKRQQMSALVVLIFSRRCSMPSRATSNFSLCS